MSKPNDVRVSRVGAVGKYDEVLKPFTQMMEKELHANSGKGDRPGWLAMSADTCMLEIYYHLGKLQKAVKDGNGDGICEYAADVANLSMMLTDICGALNLFASAQPADQQGEPAAWVECSPAWLKSGGDCASAPRICVGRHGISHLHPAHAQPATAKVDLDDVFGESQWWFKELESAVATGTLDQKRAVAVVRNLLGQIAKLNGSQS